MARSIDTPNAGPSNHGWARTAGTVRRVADRSAALAAVSEALLGIAGDLRSDAVLERLVEAARGLGGARYAALGVPDEEGDGFSRWISAGLTDEEIDAIGPLPRNHGLLGAALHDPEPFRSGDVRSDDRFDGWWPAAHPDLDAFLAVPIVFRGEVVGAFYLANKDGGLHRGRPAARARPGRPRRRAHRAQPPLRGPARAVGARGAQPPGPRAPRRPHAVAVRAPAPARGRRRGRRSLAAGGDLRRAAVADPPAAAARRSSETVSSPAWPSTSTWSAAPTGSPPASTPASLGEVEPDTEQALFRIAQEALTNVVKHAAATSVTVHLERTDGTVVARGGRRRSRLRSRAIARSRLAGSASCPCTSAPPTSAARSSSSPSPARGTSCEPRCRRG